MMHLSLTRRQYYALCTMVLLSPLLHLVPRKTAAEAGCGGWLSGAAALVPLLLTGCMLLMGVKDQMHKIEHSTLPEWVLLVVWSTGCILTLLIAPGWLNDYLAPLAAKAANTLLPIGYVALIVEMFRAQRIYLQTEEQ